MGEVKSARMFDYLQATTSQLSHTIEVFYHRNATHRVRMKLCRVVYRRDHFFGFLLKLDSKLLRAFEGTLWGQGHLVL